MNQPTVRSRSSSSETGPTHPNTPYTIVTDSSENVLHGGINELEVDTNDDGPYDADADTITFDVGNDRIVWDVQAEIFIDGDFVTLSRDLNMLVAHNVLLCCWVLGIRAGMVYRPV